MTKGPLILVTSAAGKTGLPTSLALLSKGARVRAFVRQCDRRAERLKAAGAEIFVGNLYAVQDMRLAMKGADRAYLCAPTAPNGLHFHAVAVAAAQEARLEHVVLLSQWLADPQHPSLFTREVWLGEQMTRLLGGSLTINNVGWFADNYFLMLDLVARLGLLTLPLGPGDQAKNAPPSNEDIAAVNVAALLEPERHAGQIYRPTGPALLSPNVIAGAMGKALGRRVAYQDLSENRFLKAMRAAGFPAAVYGQLLYYVREYRKGTFAVAAPNSVVEELTGRPAEPFEAIAQRYVERMGRRPGPLGRLAGLAFLFRMLATPRPDPAALERARDHVLISAPRYSQESEAWQASHPMTAAADQTTPRLALA